MQDDWKADQQADAEPRACATTTRAPTDRIGEPQRARLRSGRHADASTSAAEAAYAASPIPELPASALQGARRRCSSRPTSKPGFWNADTNNIQPRVGFAYKLNDEDGRCAAAAGIYTVSVRSSHGINQMGFSQSTPFVADAEQRPDVPVDARAIRIPSGVLQPVGATARRRTRSSARASTRSCRSTSRTRRTLALHRQRAARAARPVAARGGLRRQPRLRPDDRSSELNAIPAQYLSTSRVRDQATIDFLAAQRAESVRRPAARTGFNGATVARSQLLRPFPQFNNVPTYGYDGTSQYDSAQMKLERRFTQRLHGHWPPTPGRSSPSACSRLNPTDADYEKRLARDDVPHRVTASIIYELPFGKGRRWARNASGVTNALIGGWSVKAIGQLQSGRPIDFDGRNIYFNGDLERAEGELHRQHRRAGVRHQRLLLPRRRGADQRRRRSGQAARRHAHPPGEQHPLLPVADRRPAQPGPEPVGHLDRQAGAASAAACARSSTSSS